MKIVTVANTKGGVAKTTNVIHLANAVARHGGGRVLVVDCDHNNNLTDYYLPDAPLEDLETRSIKRVLLGVVPIEDAIYRTSDSEIDILPATTRLVTIGAELAGNLSAHMRFLSSLRRQDYSTVFIDAPPSLAYEARVGLMAADIVLSPFFFNRWAIQGVQTILDELAGIDRDTGKMPVFLAVPANVTSREDEACRDPALGVPNLAKTTILKRNPIRDSVILRKLPKDGSAAAQDFESLVVEADL